MVLNITAADQITVKASIFEGHLYNFPICRYYISLMFEIGKHIACHSIIWIDSVNYLNPFKAIPV